MPYVPPDDALTALYRFYDFDGQLLYVGVSRNPFGRFDAHAGRIYWNDIATIRIEHHPSFAAARAAEITAIQTEDPVYNIADRKRGYEPEPMARCPHCARRVCVTSLGTFRPHKVSDRRCIGSGRFASREGAA